MTNESLPEWPLQSIDGRCAFTKLADYHLAITAYWEARARLAEHNKGK